MPFVDNLYSEKVKGREVVYTAIAPFLHLSRGDR